MRSEGLCQMKISSDNTGNRTRDLPACGAVPQPTASPAACPYNQQTHNQYHNSIYITKVCMFSLHCYVFRHFLMSSSGNLQPMPCYVGGHKAVTQLVEALRYKPEGRGFNSRWCHWNFLIYIILPVALWPWG